MVGLRGTTGRRCIETSMLKACLSIVARLTVKGVYLFVSRTLGEELMFVRLKTLV